MVKRQHILFSLILTGYLQRQFFKDRKNITKNI